MAWVPPHRHNQSSKSSKGFSSDTYVTAPSSSPYRSQPLSLAVKDIQNHFWKSTDQNERSQVVYKEHATLNASAESDGKLAYVLLFHDANPKWDGQRTMFVKSNLDLLPMYTEKKAEADKMWDSGREKADIRNTVTARGVELNGDWTTIVDVRATEKFAASEDNIASEERADTAEEKWEDSEGTWKIESTVGRKTGRGFDTIPIDTKRTNLNSPPPLSQPSIPIKILPLPPVHITPSTRTPIAIFSQNSHTRLTNFSFSGWFVVKHLTILAPFSNALVDMLEEKWAPKKDRYGHVVKQKQRRPQDWTDSLGRDWVVVEFKQIEGEEAPEDPVIETQMEESFPKKSVNELLAEMRMGGGKKGE